MPPRKAEDVYPDPSIPSARELRREHANDLIRVRALTEEGLTEEEIAELTEFGPEKTHKLIQECIVEEMHAIGSQQPEEVYARFCMESRGNLRRCDELYEKFQRGDQIAGLVGVIKLRQSITESVLKRGQDMGFVRREPNKAFVLTANLTGSDLRQYVAETLSKIRKDMVMAGDDAFLDLSESSYETRPSLPPPQGLSVRSSDPLPKTKDPTGPVVRRKVLRPSLRPS